MSHLSFMTGSHVYGTPKPESDIDLVVRIEPDELEELRRSMNTTDPVDDYGTSHSLRFGSLNLICCTTDEWFEDWKQGTEVLAKKKPVEREEAVRVFKAIFAARASGLSLVPANL